MVATAVLRHIESGKLTLDDTVEKWLPGIVAKGDRMTIRQLLSHRSGVHEPQWLDELPPLTS
jgi:D-alanyl-D-alanine carboxypeptidase